MKRVFVVASLAACLASCGGGGSGPTAPSSPTYPSVAGKYSGTVTFTFPLLGGSISCPATTTVTQSGPNVTFSPMTMSGSCTDVFPSLALGDFTMSTTGSLGNASVSNLYLASCNGYYNATASGGFFGNSVQFSFNYTAMSGGCVSQLGNFTFGGTLAR